MRCAGGGEEVRTRGILGESRFQIGKRAEVGWRENRACLREERGGILCHEPVAVVFDLEPQTVSTGREEPRSDIGNVPQGGQCPGRLSAICGKREQRSSAFRAVNLAREPH